MVLTELSDEAQQPNHAQFRSVTTTSLHNIDLHDSFLEAKKFVDNGKKVAAKLGCDVVTMLADQFVPTRNVDNGLIGGEDTDVEKMTGKPLVDKASVET